MAETTRGVRTSSRKRKGPTPTGTKRSKTSSRTVDAKQAKANASAQKTEEQKKAELAAREAAKLLPGEAKAINVRLEKADKLIDQADDHRLAAALTMAQAKANCATAGLSFKKWAEENIKKSYETVRKLVPVGEAGEEKGALMLADMRAANKAANKKARDAKKKAASSGSSDKDPKAKPASKFQQATDAVTELDEKGRANLVNSVAGSMDMAVVPKAELKDLKKAKNRQTPDADLDAAKAAFDALSSGDQIKLLNYAADKLAYEVVDPMDGPQRDLDGKVEGPAASDLAIPDALKRKDGKFEDPKPTRRRKRAK